jgi:hypothetical protein
MLFMSLLSLILLAVRRLWRVGAEGEGTTTPPAGSGTQKAVNNNFTDLWSLLDKLRVLLDRNDWPRIGDLLTFLSQSLAAYPTSVALPPTLGSVFTAREAKLYNCLLPRVMAYLK